MKTHKLLFFILLLITVFTGCSDDNSMELDKGNSPLEMTASNNSIQLNVANPNGEALKFSWTSGSNQGTNASIDYTFQMDVQGNNFAGGLSIDLGNGIFEQSYTNEALNDLLLNTFGVPINTEITLESRVIATVASDKVQPQTSNVQTVTVKTYKPITKTLYLIGDATTTPTHDGWDANNAFEMNFIADISSGFTWTGSLTPGKFKFITTLGSFVPSYNKDTLNIGKLYLRESFDDPYDEQFEITEGGTYTVTVNLIMLTISVTKGQVPEYTALWFTGDSTKWYFEPMTVDLFDPFVFHYNAEVGGEFKIATDSDNWAAAFFRPVEAQTPEGINLNVIKKAGDPDNKWKITPDAYKIRLDTRKMKIDIVSFTPYPMIYLIGDAVKGWGDKVTDANTIPMTATSNPYIFTWTGALSDGQLKFSCDKKSDWMGAWFLASKEDKVPTGQVEQMWFSNPGSAPDNKWRVTAGTYSIVLDQLKETVVITKQ